MPPDTSHSTDLTIEELLDQFSTGNARKRRSLIKSVQARSAEFITLGSSLLSKFDREGDDWSAGWLLQVLQRHYSQTNDENLPSDLANWFATPSLVGIDYSPLQSSLVEQRLEEADRFTSATLRKLAGESAEERGYVYFSEVNSMAGIDLATIDRLWVAYSQGKFGFSVQARLLDSVDGRYDRLWSKIGWKIDGVWTRYPKAFDWSLNAPDGHLPLVNQLRGVRLLDALLKHPEIKSRSLRKVT